MRVLVVTNSHGGALVEALRENGQPKGADVDVRAVAGLRAALLQIKDGVLCLDKARADRLDSAQMRTFMAIRDLGLLDPAPLNDYDLVAFYRGTLSLHSFMAEPFRQTEAGRPFFSRAFLKEALEGAIRNSGVFRLQRQALAEGRGPVVFADAPFPRLRTAEEIALGLNDRDLFDRCADDGEAGDAVRTTGASSGEPAPMTPGARAEGIDASAQELSERREAVHEIVEGVCHKRGVHFFRQPADTVVDEIFTHSAYGTHKNWIGNENIRRLDLRHMNGAFGSAWLEALVTFGRALTSAAESAPPGSPDQGTILPV